MSEFGPRQPMDEEKNKKEEDEISRRDFLKKTGLAIGALIGGASALGTAGCAREDKREQEIERKTREKNKEIEEIIKKEELEKEIKKDPRAGYIDIEDYLKDYPHLKEKGYEIELEGAREYFKNQEKK